MAIFNNFPFYYLPKGDAAVCNNIIRRYFESFGTIESIETVNEEIINVSGINAASIHEAYVTFVRSEDAHNAFMANRRDSKAIKVVPADTFSQPGVVLIPLEEIKAINNANPRGEEKVNFSDVMRSFCECGQVEATVHLRQPMGLKSVFETFRPIKDRISHFKIIFDMEPNATHEDCLTDDEYVERAIQILCTCIGEQFNELTIRGASTISLKLLDDLAPMLSLIHI